VFWLTLRQFALECSTRRDSRLDAESLETLNEADGIFSYSCELFCHYEQVGRRANRGYVAYSEDDFMDCHPAGVTC